MSEVTVVPHDPRWREQFAAESRRVSDALGGNAIAVHHIGSTAVEGMLARPSIDMLVVVKGLDAVDAKRTELESLGYEGIVEYADSYQRYLRKERNGSYRLMVFVSGWTRIERILDFRDYLIAHPETAREYGELKLHLAAKFADDLQGYLAGKNEFIGDIDLKTLMIRTPAYRLILAARESSDALSVLVRESPELMLGRTGLGETPLHHLVVENEIEAVKPLVESGSEVNTVNKCGGTPLSEAAWLGHEELVEYLLSCGAKLHLEGQDDLTLHHAVRGGKLSTVRRIIDEGAKVDEADSLRGQAIHLAAESDENIAILQLLIERGADPNAKQLFDETPLDVAIEYGAHACADLLTALGAQRGNE